MTEKELLKEVKKETGIDYDTILLVWNTAWRIMREKLLFGIDITLKGKIRFELYSTSLQSYVNPKTGEYVKRTGKQYKIRSVWPRDVILKLREKKVY